MSNFKFTRDKLLGVIASVLGLVVLIAGSRLKALIVLDEPGPRLFPMISGAGMLLCGLIILFRKDDKEYQPFMDRAGFLRMAVLYAILMLYVFVGLEYVGYLISTPVLLMVLYWVLAEEGKKPKVWFCILFGLAVGLLLYFFFTGIKISLPKGVILKSLFGLKW